MEKIIDILLFWYLFCLNILAFISCFWDKFQARRHGWRIPERTLLSLSGLGGAAGMFLGMQLFRHKTRHKKFTVLVPLFLLLQLALLALYLFYLRGLL